MTNHILHPLVNLFMDNEYSMMTYGENFGVKKEIPVIFWLIRGGGRTILVDSGACDAEQATKTHYPAHQTVDMLPQNLLAARGVRPEDVEHVVLTHLHWDHCYNLELFPNAAIHLQRRELVYALNPHPCHWTPYESSRSGLTPTWPKHLNRFELRDGDFTLAPGIDVYHLPGHSPGMQGVAVQTAAGRYLIASDNIPLYRNWEGDGRQRHIPSNVHYDLDEYYASLDRMEAICDVVLPDHDTAMLVHTQFPPQA